MIEEAIMNRIDVGVVGCGDVADGHIRAWKKVPQAEIKAVCDLNETLASSTATTWKIPTYYTTMSELVQSGSVNVVDIATPPHTHADLAIEAMKAGVNVLIEKPMTMTVEDATRIIECQRETGVKAGVIHNWLFDAPVIEASLSVKKGILGKLVNVEVEAISTKFDYMAANKNHWCHRFPGGRFSEMLAHPIYLIRHFLGGEPTLEDVQVAKVGEYDWMKSDELTAAFRVGEKLGRAYATFNAPKKAIFINLYGTDAILKLDVINSTKVLIPRRKTTRFNRGYDSLSQASQLVKSTLGNIGKIATGRWLSGHDTCINFFAQSLINKTDPPVTLEDGLRVIEVLEEICKQIEGKEKMRLKETKNNTA
jgi:predicted dehydrogenase